MLKVVAKLLDVTLDYLLLLVDEENSRLEESGLDEREVKFIRMLRRNPQLKQLAYQLFHVDDSGGNNFLPRGDDDDKKI